MHVARNKSITLSCEELDISQPALTRSIKRLESVLQHDVFTRNSRGVELTEEGKIFYKYAEKLENEFNTTLKEINAASENQVLEIMIGADNLWAEAYLTDVLIKFNNEHPNAQFRVIGGPVKSHLTSLIDGKLDIVLGSSDFEVANANEIFKKKLSKIKYYIIGNKEHPLMSKSNIGISDLVNYYWVIYQNSSSFVWDINELYEENGLPRAKIALHTAFLPQAIKHVKSSDCLMFVPEQLLEYMENNNLYEIPDLGPIHTMDTGYVVLDKSRKRMEIRQLIQLIESSI